MQTTLAPQIFFISYGQNFLVQVVLVGPRLSLTCSDQTKLAAVQKLANGLHYLTAFLIQLGCTEK